MGLQGVGIAYGFFVLGLVLQYGVARRLPALVARQERLEGDFRGTHFRVRHRAQAIALAGGAQVRHPLARERAHVAQTGLLTPQRCRGYAGGAGGSGPGARGGAGEPAAAAGLAPRPEGGDERSGLPGGGGELPHLRRPRLLRPRPLGRPHPRAGGPAGVQLVLRDAAAHLLLHPGPGRVQGPHRPRGLRPPRPAAPRRPRGRPDRAHTDVRGRRGGAGGGRGRGRGGRGRSRPGSGSRVHDSCDGRERDRGWDPAGAEGGPVDAEAAVAGGIPRGTRGVLGARRPPRPPPRALPPVPPAGGGRRAVRAAAARAHLPVLHPGTAAAPGSVPSKHTHWRRCRRCSSTPRSPSAPGHERAGRTDSD